MNIELKNFKTEQDAKKFISDNFMNPELFPALKPIFPDLYDEDLENICKEEQELRFRFLSALESEITIQEQISDAVIQDYYNGRNDFTDEDYDTAKEVEKQAVRLWSMIVVGQSDYMAERDKDADTLINDEVLKDSNPKPQNDYDFDDDIPF